MKSSIVFFLILILSLTASAAVKKKRFDVGTTDAATASVEAVVDTASAEQAVSSVQPTSTQTSFVTIISQAQKTLREKITAAISSMKSGEGPGHGKSIVVGYFIARRGRWRQGVALGAGITIVHTLSAVLLLLILYAIFKATVFPAFETGRMGVEKASYILIMITGLLLVVLAIRDLLKRKKIESEHSEIMPPTAKWREIIGVAAITGIVPCPAVALIVLFCLLNSMVALSLLGALVICIGMTITNVAFGIAAVAFRKGIDAGSKHSRFATTIYTVATLAGGILIFVSGLLLFSNLFAGRV